MRKKIERWIAKKLGIKPEDVFLTSIEVKYSFMNPVTMSLSDGKKEINLKEL